MTNDSGEFAPTPTWPEQSLIARAESFFDTKA